MEKVAAASAADNLDDSAKAEATLDGTSLLAPRLRERRRIRHLLPIQRDLLRRIETNNATVARGIRLGVVLGIGEGVAFHGDSGAVAEEDGLAVGFVVGAGDDGGADGGVDVIVFDTRVLDTDEVHGGAAAAGEGVAGYDESLDGRDAEAALRIVGVSVDGGLVGA